MWAYKFTAAIYVGSFSALNEVNLGFTFKLLPNSISGQQVKPKPSCFYIVLYRDFYFMAVNEVFDFS